MNVSVKYIESHANPSAMRRGGVVLKGNARSDRQAVHLVFLIDTSGSMEEEHKLQNVIKSMNFILSFLTGQDQISLITFNDTADTMMTRNTVTPDQKQAIEYKIHQMRADGSTNLSAGLFSAGQILEQAAVDGIERKQGLIILTDGHANVGVRDDTTLLEILRNLMTRTAGLSVTTVAYGADHNADLLSKMGVEGGGSYNIVKNLEDVASVFGEILGGLLSVSAQMIEVYLPPGATTETLYPTQVLEGGITKVRIGDLYAEAEQTLLFRSAPEQGPIRVTAVRLPDFTRIDERFDVELLTDGQEPDATLQLANFRQQVSSILREARTRSPTDDLKMRASQLRQLIENSSFRENPLAQMMMEDLRGIVEFQRPSRGGGAAWASMTSAMAQHETYLGVSRGLRSPTSAVRSVQRSVPLSRAATMAYDPDEPPMAAPPLSALVQQTSVFSNQIQRDITEALRTMSMQPEPENHSSQPVTPPQTPLRQNPSQMEEVD